MKQRNATAADAELILKLYDLRREALMRKARDSVANFWPRSAEEVLQIAQAFGTEQNAYFRQVVSYWEMAASLVLKGTLNEELFLESGGEMVFVFAKLSPFLPDIRKAMNAPEFFSRVEKLLNGSQKGRQMLKATLERVRMIGEVRRKAAGK
jgi:hypothetical protein